MLNQIEIFFLGWMNRFQSTRRLRSWFRRFRRRFKYLFNFRSWGWENESCDDCGHCFRIAWNVRNEIWSAVNDCYEGCYCLDCFIERAEKKRIVIDASDFDWLCVFSRAGERNIIPGWCSVTKNKDQAYRERVYDKVREAHKKFIKTIKNLTRECTPNEIREDLPVEVEEQLQVMAAERGCDRESEYAGCEECESYDKCVAKSHTLIGKS